MGGAAEVGGIADEGRGWEGEGEGHGGVGSFVREGGFPGGVGLAVNT